MAIRNYLQKLNPFYQLKAQYADIKKQLEIYKRAEQPYSAEYNHMGTVIPLYPYALDTIYQLAYFSDVITTIHRALRTQMFKNGYEVIKSSETDSQVVDVDEDLNTEPDEEDRKKILRFLKRVNAQSQELEEVLKELEDDLNILDLYFCNFRFDYYFDGKELHRELFEIQRIDPRTMSLVINNRRQYAMDDLGRKLSFSISDRSKLLHDTELDSNGTPTLPAWYKQTRNGSELYFSEHEFVMGKRYRPTELLGFSPIVTTWQKVRTLQQQDKYILELYEGKRPPKGMLAFNTSNRDSLREAWDEMLKKARINPHLPAVLGVTNNNQGKFVEFIDFMKSLDELQFTEQRDEYRRVLGAVYGVSPVFQNDSSTGGGLNNEGLQITVTNDAIQDGQHNYNNKLLKKIVHELGFVGWSVLLRPSEEQDEMARLQIQDQSLRNGEIASRMGLKVKYDSRQGICVIEDGDIAAPAEPQADLFDNPFEDTDADGTPEEVAPDDDKTI